MSNLTIQQSYLPSTTEYTMLKDIAITAFESGLLPTSIKTKQAAFIIALKGRELGIPPMQAFSHINVINGKPTMSSELMLAQIFKCVPKAQINYIETNGKGCIIEAARPNCKSSIFAFNEEDAQKAGLLSKDTWKKYPDAMYRARAISAMARALFADALMGVSYTAEELGCEVDIDENGNEIIKDVTPKEAQKEKSKAEPVGEIEKPKQDPKEEPKQIINHAPQNSFETFKIKSGQYKDMKFSEINLIDLKTFVEKISYSYNKDNPNHIEFFDNYNAFLRSRGEFVNNPRSQQLEHEQQKSELTKG